ncbi:MAG: thioredoxin family protein [Bacteroidales bacterium]
MKRLIFFIIVPVFIAGCSSTRKVADVQPVVQQEAVISQPATHVNFSDQSTWLLGYFNRNRLSAEPYSEWFVTGMDSYKYDEGAVNKLKELGFSGLTIKIVLGTWCPDSRREVPRFFRVLDAVNFPSDKIELVGVDNSKFSPIENYQSLNIIRVPTFIFYKNNVEVGRIIENPSTSLEQDMVNILTKE